jgi:hypothetical protein
MNCPAGYEIDLRDSFSNNSISKMKKNKSFERIAPYAFILCLLICRVFYLYFGKKNTVRESLIRLGVDVGNFAIIAVFGFFITFVILFIQAKFFKRK